MTATEEKKLRKAVLKVWDYNVHEEERHFLGCDDDEVESHIMKHLATLEDWYNGDPLGTRFRELKKQRREEN